MDVASVEDCEQALATLATRLAEKNADGSSDLDRSLACSIRDLDVRFAGRLRHGQLEDITRVSKADAQITLTLTSDDLVALVDGELNLGAAWASGRVKVSAGVRDMLKLRSIF